MFATLTPLAVLLAVTLFQTGIILFVMVTLASAGAFAFYSLMFPPTSAAERLEALTQANDPEAEIQAAREQRALEAVAARLGKLAQSEDVDAAEQLRRKLMYAGYASRRAPEVFGGVRVALLIGLPVLASPMAFYSEVKLAAAAMVIAALLGYYMPFLVITSMAQNRQAELLRSYPDALDLMVSSVESGLSLDQAFKRVAMEMRTVSPSLSKEFSMVNSQTAAGIDRITALKKLEERTGLEEVRSFVNMLAQAERFGSSVSASMRLYSQVAREKRIARAEEKAGQVGSKLTIIMIVFFLPVLFYALGGPPAIRIGFPEELPEPEEAEPTDLEAMAEEVGGAMP
jgi:tight adherence protein C